MTDESDDPPVIPFPATKPAPPRDAMSERGARPITPPPTEPEPKPFVTESEAKQLRYIVQVAVEGKPSIDWAAEMALRVIDTGGFPSDLLRYAARQHLRQLVEEVTRAGERTTMRAGAVFACLAYEPDRRKPFVPPPTANVKLDLSLLDVCNLCSKRPSTGNGFTLTWPIADGSGDIRVRYCGECVARAIAFEHRRLEEGFD